jgi:hypothetical protein
MPDDRRTGAGGSPVWWTIDPAIARAATLPAEVYAHFHSLLAGFLSSE